MTTDNIKNKIIYNSSIVYPNFIISIIIPMYNSQMFIEECIESILSQTLDKNFIEIICVDDGSTDNTINICNEYKKTNNNIFIITTPHKGVSHARNQGILFAHGKYIGFLDSDDTITPHTLKNLIKYFDDHYLETDIITYDTLYLTNKTLSESSRNKLVKKNEIINLSAFIYLAQSRINILVKNNKEILFDETMTQYEDQQYLIDLCIKKGTIGYCKQAEYIYRQHSSGTVENKTHPYYFFEELMNLFQKWLYNYKNNKCISYIKCLILYDFMWRLRSDRLLPYHYKGKSFDEALSKFQNILNSIDNRLIINHPLLIAPYKEYFLTKKTKNKPFYIINHEKWFICDKNGELYSSNKVLCVFQKITIKEDKFICSGFIKSPISNFIEKPNFYSVINDYKNKNIELYHSSWSHFETKALTNNYWGFSIEYNLESMEKIFFYIKIENKNFPLYYWFMDMNQISTKRKNYIHFGKKCIIFSNNAFFIYSNREPEIKKKKNTYLKSLRQRYYGHLLLISLAKNKYDKKNIWLYNDINDLFDNAYYQFKHDFQKKDKVERYYILNKEIKDIDKYFTNEEKKYIIFFKSKEHKMLFLCCKKIITSFSQTYFYIPFTSKSLSYFFHILDFEIIYLQHGVMHAKIPFLYAKDRNSIDKIVISTFFEKDHLIKNMNYKEKDLIPVGMSRFDILEQYRNIIPKNKILFAPSWRRYLVHQDIDKWFPKEEFDKSDYYRSILSLISDKNIIHFLEKYNYNLDIKLHPIMSMYKNKFISLSKNIKIIDYVKIEEYKLFITDFSSYVYDFIYLNKPVIYFIPDRNQIDAGLHSYREFYISPEDGLGDYTENHLDLILKIINMHKNEFRIKIEYKEKYKNLFLYQKANHREMIYSYL